MMDRKNGGKRQFHTLRRLLRGRRGATLIELVVTFALIGLFAAGTCQIISTSIKVYHQVRGLNNARQVADTLMDKITGEIEGAQVGVQYEEADEENDGITLWIKDAGATIDLYDRTGSHIYITSKDRKMVIHYYPVMYEVENESGTSSKETVYKEVDWAFDEGVYMGFHISSLKFARADQSLYPENVIRVDMDLTGGGYGTFHTTRYVECYNFVTDQDFDKIKDDSEGGGGGVAPDTPGEDIPEKETYPGTDIVLQPNYWPRQEEWTDDKWVEISVQPGGIFQYDDGEYYVVTRPVKVNKDQAKPGPMSVYGWDCTQKITGTFIDFIGNEERSDLKRGDLCLYNGEYYVYIDNGSYGKNPSLTPGHWYKIPNQ